MSPGKDRWVGVLDKAPPDAEKSHYGEGRGLSEEGKGAENSCHGGFLTQNVAQLDIHNCAVPIFLLGEQYPHFTS